MPATPGDTQTSWGPLPPPQRHREQSSSSSQARCHVAILMGLFSPLPLCFSLCPRRVGRGFSSPQVSPTSPGTPHRRVHQQPNSQTHFVCGLTKAKRGHGQVPWKTARPSGDPRQPHRTPPTPLPSPPEPGRGTGGALHSYPHVCMDTHPMLRGFPAKSSSIASAEMQRAEGSGPKCYQQAPG